MKTTKKLTPTQLRAKIISVLRSNYNYQVKELMREFGRNKAWMRSADSCRAHKKRAHDIAKALAVNGIRDARVTKAYAGEWHVDGRGFRIVVNQDSDTGNGGGVFVETVKSVGDFWREHDGHPGAWQ